VVRDVVVWTTILRIHVNDEQDHKLFRGGVDCGDEDALLGEVVEDN
jgi:hypothetical protein